MKTNEKSQVTSGRKDRPLHSPALSAAWGRALGVALLMLSAVPSYAGTKPSQNNGDATTAKPNSVVWGKGPVPPPVVSTLVAVLGGGTADDTTRKLSPEFQPTTSGSFGGASMVTVIVQYRQMPTSAHLQSLQSGGASIRSKFH